MFCMLEVPAVTMCWWGGENYLICIRNMDGCHKTYVKSALWISILNKSEVVNYMNWDLTNPPVFTCMLICLILHCGCWCITAGFFIPHPCQLSISGTAWNPAGTCVVCAASGQKPTGYFEKEKVQSAQNFKQVYWRRSLAGNTND